MIELREKVFDTSDGSVYAYAEINHYDDGQTALYYYSVRGRKVLANGNLWSESEITYDDDSFLNECFNGFTSYGIRNCKTLFDKEAVIGDYYASLLYLGLKKIADEFNTMAEEYVQR